MAESWGLCVKLVLRNKGKERSEDQVKPAVAEKYQRELMVGSNEWSPEQTGSNGTSPRKGPRAFMFALGACMCGAQVSFC